MITVLVPSHNRHQYLSRVIKYYGNYNVQLVIVDSSSSPYQINNKDDYLYLHFPNSSFSEKILKALTYINDTFVVLSADDDFFYYSAIQKAVLIMHKNVNISLFTGEYEFFDVSNPDQFYPNPSAFPNNNILLSYPKENQIAHFMSNYSQILWSVYRKDLLLGAMKAIKLHKYKNDNFIELTVAALAFHNGNIFFHNKYVGVREVIHTTHWGTRHASIVNSNKIEIDSYSLAIAKLCSSSIAKILISNYMKFVNKRRNLIFRLYRYVRIKLSFNKFSSNDQESVKKVIVEFNK